MFRKASGQTSTLRKGSRVAVKNGVVVLAVVLSIASFAGMLRLKSDVEQQVSLRSKLVRERSSLKEEKLILLAELAYLAQPDRLQKLAEKQNFVELDMLNLQPMEVSGGLVP